jgi:gliding motility-associated-like protein
LIEAEPLTKTCPNAADGKARIISVSGGVPGYTYNWATTPAQTTDTAINLPSGTYTVNVTDAKGCVTSRSIVIEDHTPPVVDAGTDTVICPGGVATLTASGANNYTWSPTTNLSCATCASTTAKPGVSIVYTVVGVDANNCRDTDQVFVAIADKKGGEVGPDIKICRGDNIQLHASGGIAYTWTPGELLNNAQLSDPTLIADSNRKFRVVIKENECFYDTLYQQVTVYERPTVELGPDLAGIPGATLQLNADVTNTTSINWTPQTLLSCYDCYRPLATLNKTITYTATVTNDSVCFAEDNITIHVACDGSFLFIPNTFTPNGDGNNDRFFVSGQGLNTISLFRIYNRWGQMMYEAKNIPPNDEMKGWDGKYKNNDLPPDVYVYYLEINCNGDEKIFLKGDISIIR